MKAPAHVGVVLLSLLLLYQMPFNALDRAFYDQALRARLAADATRPVDPLIVMVTLDDHTWMQWDDTRAQLNGMASLLRALRRLNCDVVVLDLLMSHGTADEQRPLYEAIRELGPEHVVLGAIDVPGEKGTVPAFAEQLRDFPVGMFTFRQPRDGVLRDYPMLSPVASRPSLALAAYRCMRGVDEREVAVADGLVRWSELSPDGRQPLRREVPRDVVLDFRAPWEPPPGHDAQAFKHITATEVLAKAQQGGNDELQGAVALIGFDSAGAGDLGTTPLDDRVPKTVLHMTALNDLLQDSWHVVAPPSVQALLTLVMLGLALTVSRVRGFTPVALLWLLAVAALLLGGGWLVWRRHLLLDVATATACCTLVMLVEMARRYVRESAAREQLRHVMSFYFSPRVLEQVLRTPGALEAQQADVVLLLTDLRNFTTISERLGPQPLFLLLNRVFEVQTEAVMAEDGSLEHFLGDQFLSYWGAPGVQPDAADRALRATLALLVAMQRLADELPREVREAFGFGVALHAGPVLIGNKGSARRLDYGLIGDTVNSAARIEALTKLYGVRCLITREVLSQLSQPPPHRVVDRVLPVGKSNALELLDIQHVLSPPHFTAVATRYGEAFERYLRGEFTAARSGFEALAAEFDDGPARLLAARCRQLETHAPAVWSGIFELHHQELRPFCGREEALPDRRIERA